MKRVLVGQINANEREVLVKILEKKHTLEEILVAMNKRPQWTSDTAKMRLQTDLLESSHELQMWWQTTANAHCWTYSAGDTWEVDFSTLNVYITVHKET